MSATDLARIQHAARYGRVILTQHAQDEAENANVQAHDVEHAIRSATVALAQEHGKFRLEGGTALDGETLVVVVREIQRGLLVITVF
jgi:hypothetical protein